MERNTVRKLGLLASLAGAAAMGVGIGLPLGYSSSTKAINNYFTNTEVINEYNTLKNSLADVDSTRKNLRDSELERFRDRLDAREAILRERIDAFYSENREVIDNHIHSLENSYDLIKKLFGGLVVGGLVTVAFGFSLYRSREASPPIAIEEEDDSTL